MKKLRIDDFSGGIAPDGVVTSDRQVLDAHGLVLDDQARLRSQFAIDKVGSALDNITQVQSFVTDNNTFLIALDDTGKVHWAVAPAPGSSAADANNTVWNELPGVGSTEYNLLSQIRWREGDLSTGFEFVAAFLISVPPKPNTPAPAVVLTEDSPTSLAFETISDFYPELVTVDPPVPASGKMPHASVACMWNDFLVLGDIEWSSTNTGVDGGDSLSPANVRRYSNYVWLSDPLDTTSFDPQYPVRVCEEGAEILGLLPTEEGLYVFSTNAGGESGITLLRGDGSEYTGSDPDGRLSQVSEMSPAGRPTYWAEQRSMLFTTSDARLFEYNYGELADLTPTLSAAPPGESGLAFATGRWILFADPRVRDSNFLADDPASPTVDELPSSWLWVMRSFGTEGGWTRLNTGSLTDFASPCAAHDDVVALFSDDAGTYAFRIRTSLDADSGGRGVVDGTPVTMRAKTPDLGERSPFDVVMWQQVGLIFSDSDNADISVDQYVRVPNGDQASFRQPAASGISGRSRIPVRGPGDSTSLEIVVEVTGDATLSALELTWEASAQEF